MGLGVGREQSWTWSSIFNCFFFYFTYGTVSQLQRKEKGNIPIGGESIWCVFLESSSKQFWALAWHVMYVLRLHNISQVFTFVSFLFPAVHLTCHVFPVNSSPHSIPCQQNADDFRALQRIIRWTFRGKCSKHRVQFTHKSVNTKSVHSSARSMQEFPLQLQFNFRITKLYN